MSGQRKPGLWHGPRRVEIEAVKQSMSKPCSRCGDAPEHRRLHVVEGVGRSGKVAVYCEVCARRWLRERLREVKRALKFMRTGEGAIRDGTSDS